MTMVLPDKLRTMTPYVPISGNYPVRLDANESNASLSPARIAEAVQRILPNRYPDPYCRRLCERFAAHYGIPVDGIVMGNGSDELISILIGCLLNKGDAVAIAEMDFSMYRFYTDLYECRPVMAPKAENLRMDVDAMIDTARREHAKMVIFSNPCNPTSLLLPRNEVLRMLSELDCIVVVDEAYMEFAGNHSVMNISYVNPRLIVLKTFSKAFGLAAIRLGAAVAGETLANAVKAAKPPYNVNALTQAIGEEALSDPAALSLNVRSALAEREFLLRSLRKIARDNPCVGVIYESATNFIFFKVRGAQKVFEGLKANGVIVRLMGEHLRVTTGSRDENERFLQLFKMVL